MLEEQPLENKYMRSTFSQRFCSECLVLRVIMHECGRCFQKKSFTAALLVCQSLGKSFACSCVVQISWLKQWFEVIFCMGQFPSNFREVYIKIFSCFAHYGTLSSCCHFQLTITSFAWGAATQTTCYIYIINIILLSFSLSNYLD